MEEEERGHGGELSQVDTSLLDITLLDSSRDMRPALPVWLQCRYYGQL